jgi:phage head maturation protease
MEHKAIKISFKSDKEGSFSAVIATLNVEDSDGDITEPGAFPTGKELVVSAYQHGSWQGALPVGKAVIREAGNLVIADGEFNLASVSGKDHYETVKFTGDLQEWSYGFWPTKWRKEEREGKEVRILEAVDPIEISPVLKGAGVGTATLGIKNLSFAEHFEVVLAAVKDVSERTKSLADLRRKEGRALSPAKREQVKELRAQLSALAAGMDELVEIPDSATMRGLFMNYQKTLTEVLP